MPSSNKSNKEACASRTRSKVPNVYKPRNGSKGQFRGEKSVLMSQVMYDSGTDSVFSQNFNQESEKRRHKFLDTDSDINSTTGSSKVPERREISRLKYVFGATKDCFEKTQALSDQSLNFQEEIQSIASIDDFKPSTQNTSTVYGSYGLESSFIETKSKKSEQKMSFSSDLGSLKPTNKITQDSGKVSVISLLNVESLSTDSRESSPGL